MNPEKVVSRNLALPWWLSLVVVVDALLLATGAVIAFVSPAMLVSPHAEINEAVQIYAGYLASRNLTIAAFLIAALIIGVRQMLSSLLLLTAFIQLMDAGIDGIEGRGAIAPGVLVLGILFLISARRISGFPFWRIESWKDSKVSSDERHLESSMLGCGLWPAERRRRPRYTIRGENHGSVCLL